MTTIETVTMYDTIGDTAHNVPAMAEKIAIYVTGTPDIQWSAASIARFPRAGVVRIDQSGPKAGFAYTAGHADVRDLEARADTVEEFATEAASRHGRGAGNCIYASRATLQAAAAEFDKVQKPGGWWVGMDCWLADPSLSLAEATQLVGTLLYGFRVRAVQWAWPSTNPATEVPGGTLAELNLDLSIAEAAWFPAKPAAPTWQAQALTAVKDAQTYLANAEKLLAEHL